MVIIHFLPIEKYPPVTNLINYLCEQKKIHPIIVLTTKNELNLKPYSNPGAKIIRFNAINSLSRLRLLNYMYFYIGSIIRLIIKRPNEILWYETLSSFPAIIYYWIRIKKPLLLVHYHEYMTPNEIQNGMFLVRWFNRLEERIYPKIQWLSHTNNTRLDYFIKEHPSIPKNIVKVMPNYPPRWWSNYAIEKKNIDKPVKLVYVGVLSPKTLYLEELIDFLNKSKGQLICDIYSFDIDSSTQEYFNNNPCKYLKIKGTLQQSDFPKVISQYDVGLILYKGHIPNFVHNAPNKLFEYMNCGLDVWFSKEMNGTYPYIQTKSYPKVIPIDYKNLDKFNWENAINRSNYPYKSSKYYSENAFKEFYKYQLNNH